MQQPDAKQRRKHYPKGIKPLPPAEFDAQGRRMCGAKTRAGTPCRSPAMAGSPRCRMHGGATPNSRRAAKLRLTALVEPAIATLAREMVKAEKSSDKQRAANSILDRSGFGRVTRVESNAEEAKAMLLAKLLELKANGGAPSTALSALETASGDDDAIDAVIEP